MLVKLKMTLPELEMLDTETCGSGYLEAFFSSFGLSSYLNAFIQSNPVPVVSPIAGNYDAAYDASVSRSVD